MFFSDDVGMVFRPFGVLHYLLFFLIIAGSLMLHYFRERIRHYRHERRAAQIWALMALLWEFALYAWHLGNGHRDWTEVLPIGLCGFTLYLGMIALFFNRRSVFEIGYFWTWGAVASVLFPDISFSLDRFRFYQFMLGHMSIFFMYVYMIFVYEWVPDWASWRRSAGILAVGAVIFALLSNLTGRNLIFMLNGEETPLSLFEGHSYPHYLLGAVSLALIMTLIWYLPFLFFGKDRRSAEG